MRKDMTYFALKEELAEGNDCPICKLRESAVAQYMDSLLYEQVNDVNTRTQIKESHGFCRLHTWQLRALGDPLGHAIIYRDLIDSVLKSLDGSLTASFRSTFGLKTSNMPPLLAELSHSRPCPICRYAEESENRYMTTLLQFLASDKDIRSLYEASPGLCLPHFRQAVEHGNPNTAKVLIAKEKQTLEALSANLTRLIEKFDYRFSNEPWTGEKDAWIKAIKHWVGLIGITNPNRSEG